MTDAALGNIVGAAYDAVAFGDAAQAMIEAMASGVEAAFGAVLRGLGWMDGDTKARALLKLSQVTRRVGAPDGPSFYPGFDVLPGLLLESTLRKNAYDVNNSIASIGKQPDKTAWQMTADTVNAYYNVSVLTGRLRILERRDRRTQAEEREEIVL